jgi:predicted short-subunit dehydrogenase-like oxidoreductase (DUF2520 family)
LPFGWLPLSSICCRSLAESSRSITSVPLPLASMIGEAPYTVSCVLMAGAVPDLSPRLRSTVAAASLVALVVACDWLESQSVFSRLTSANCTKLSSVPMMTVPSPLIFSR